MKREVDADLLNRAERRVDANYLWGSSVEMTLKSAYFPMLGYAAGQTITTQTMRQQLIALANRTGGAFTAPQDLHNIGAWCEAVIWQRQLPGRPMSMRFASENRPFLTSFRSCSRAENGLKLSGSNEPV
ncbi:MAG: hypothetical protein ACK5Q5_23315 [Planctomycetaceae bacterium]